MLEDTTQERPISVQTEQAGDVLVIRLAGQVNELAADSLSACLDRILAEDHLFIVFDMREVTFLSSTGLGQIMRALRTVKRKNGFVRIAGAQPLIADVFRLTKLDKLVPLCPTLEEALKI
jgi:anti-sigma B factor antagonist